MKTEKASPKTRLILCRPRAFALQFTVEWLTLSGLEKSPSGSPGQLDFLAGLVTFKACLPKGQVFRLAIL